MAYSNAVIRANNFVVELLPNVTEGFLQTIKNFGPNQKISRSLTESNISGIESLNVTTTYENIVLRSNFSSEYICDLNDEFELIIGGKYSNYMVNLPFTVINKKQQWSLCCKINFTLHLSQLQEKGLYMVINIPLFGIQVVSNYNCITKDITISFRLPLIDGNNGDRNNASSNGCNLICLNTDFIKNKIDKRIFDGKNYAPLLPPITPPWSSPSPIDPNPPNSRTFITPPYIPPKPKPQPQNSFNTQTIQPQPNPTPPPTTPKPQPVQKGDKESDLNKAMNRIDKFIAGISDKLPPSGNNNTNQNYQQQPQQITTTHRTYVTITPPFIPPKPSYTPEVPPPPPPPPRHQQPYQSTSKTADYYNLHNPPPYSNTPVVTPPYIPPRPTTILPSSNGSYSYYTQNYSTQSNYQYQYGYDGYGRQFGSNTIQSNISTNQWKTVNVTNPPPALPPPPQSISAPTTPIIQAQTISTTTTTTTKTEPVRKGVGQFNSGVNKAMDGIDRLVTKASNALSSPRNKNANSSQQQHSTSVVKAN